MGNWKAWPGSPEDAVGLEWNHPDVELIYDVSDFPSEKNNWNGCHL